MDVTITFVNISHIAYFSVSYRSVENMRHLVQCTLCPFCFLILVSCVQQVNCVEHRRISRLKEDSRAYFFLCFCAESMVYFFSGGFQQNFLPYFLLRSQRRKLNHCSNCKLTHIHEIPIPNGIEYDLPCFRNLFTFWLRIKIIYTISLVIRFSNIAKCDKKCGRISSTLQ